MPHLLKWATDFGRLKNGMQREGKCRRLSEVSSPEDRSLFFVRVLRVSWGVLGQGNWTQEEQHIDRRIEQVWDRDRGRITRRTMTYENQAQVEAHESPRGRRLPWQLRCATKRDDGQVAPATDEGHTPPAGTLKSGGNRVAGVCWAGPVNANLARQMRF